MKREVSLEHIRFLRYYKRIALSVFESHPNNFYE